MESIHEIFFNNNKLKNNTVTNSLFPASTCNTMLAKTCLKMKRFHIRSAAFCKFGQIAKNLLLY